MVLIKQKINWWSWQCVAIKIISGIEQGTKSRDESEISISVHRLQKFVRNDSSFARDLTRDNGYPIAQGIQERNYKRFRIKSIFYEILKWRTSLTVIKSKGKQN